MDMDCEVAARAASRAMESPLVDPDGVRLLSAHVASCSDCAARYAAILPFLRRDSGGPFFSAAAGAETATAEAVMARLPPARAKRIARFPIAARISSIAAAAAAALFILGFLLSRNSGTVEIRFSLVAPQASSVVLAADFTSWAENGHRMRLNPSTGAWEVKVRLRRGKSYRYNFVIDGKDWIPDPGSELILDDGFGNKSSSISI